MLGESLRVLPPAEREERKPSAVLLQVPFRQPLIRRQIAEDNEVEEPPLDDTYNISDALYNSAKQYFKAEKFEEALEEFRLCERRLESQIPSVTAATFRNLAYYLDQCEMRLEREQRILQGAAQRRPRP